MEIPSKIRFADENVQKAFNKLEQGNRDEKQLYDNLRSAFNEIEKNAFCGIQIPKKQIPKEYVKDYKVTNLWKYDLPYAWRLIYSIENQQIYVVSIVLEWMTHKEYNRRFHY